MLRGRIWTGAGAAHALVEDGVIEVSAGTIRCVRPAESTDAPAELDQYGRPHTFLPGLVDLHNHGGGGHSFPTSDADGCGIAAQHHRSRGTTTLLASLVSAEGPALVRQAGVLSQLAEEEMVSGIHLEGPFLSSRRRGAHDPAALVPGDPELLLRIIEAARGHLRSITIAPETDNLQKLLQVCSDHRVVVSLGHSDASVAETEDALEAASAAGVAVTATHLFNAMPALDHRDPGIAGALLRAAAEGRLVAELVADGVHLDDVMVAIALSAAPAQIAFVSDAMAAAGMKDGTYTLGDSAVVVRDAVARLAAPPWPTGSARWRHVCPGGPSDPACRRSPAVGAHKIKCGDQPSCTCCPSVHADACPGDRTERPWPACTRAAGRCGAARFAGESFKGADSGSGTVMPTDPEPRPLRLGDSDGDRDPQRPCGGSSACCRHP